MGGGGGESRLCAAHYPLNPNLFLYTLLFTFYFFVIASKCIAQVWQAIKSKMLCQIDCHAKNRLCSFLLAMTARQKFKFFTQNSRYFINLSQISSHTQGFFIFLPQIFAQCKLINIILQGGHYV